MIDVSVIIPTYNRAGILPELIESWRKVADTARCSFEIIFSDDGSDDGTVPLLEEARGLPLTIVRNAHKGVWHARNAAMGVARGRRVLFTGDDIFPAPDLVDCHVDISASRSWNTAVLGRIDWHKAVPVNHLMRHVTKTGCEQFAFPRLTPHSLVNYQHFYTSNISVDREFLMTFGGAFSDKFHKVNYEDIELGYRMSRKGLVILYCPEAGAYHLHPYRVKDFCRRQENAGEMAWVLETLHPELESLLEVEKVSRRFLRYRKGMKGAPATGGREAGRTLRDVADCAEELEDRLASREDDNQSIPILLSSIYHSLFRAYYELGILKGSGTGEEDDYERFLMSSYFPWSYVCDYRPPRLRVYDLQRMWENPGIDTTFPSTWRTMITGRVPFLLASAKAAARAGRRYAGRVKRGVERRLAGRKESPLGPARLDVVLPEAPTPEEAERFALRFGPGHTFVVNGEAREESVRTPADYVYAPKGWDGMMENWQLQSVLLSLHLTRPEFVLLSRSLETFPLVGLDTLENQLVFSSRYGRSRASFLGNPSTGRMMRLPSARTAGSLVDLRKEPLGGARIGTGSAAGAGAAVSSKPESAGKGATFIPPFRKGKKLIFVFPTFLAVGGVERNTVAVIKEAKSSYDFVIVNFEPLRPALGSLHYQFAPHVEGIYDLPEIVERGRYLEALVELKKVYNPDLVWICNGSPWLAQNLANVRKVFDDVPVVDQQVYDTKEGWIGIYHEPGIHSFDRFIAINSRIRDAFTGTYRIEGGRVDLIYHAIDTERIDRARRNPPDVGAVRRAYGLPPDKPLLLFIGRLTPQKRPLDLLKLAEKAGGRNGRDHFVMVGDGELAGEVEAFIRERGLTNVTRVPFAENPMDLMTIAEGLIVVSQYEGLPIAMLESMAMGLPVLSTDVGDAALVLGEYGTGTIVRNPGDLGELVSKFRFWKDNLAELGQRARSRSDEVLARFSCRNVAREYASVWEKAMEERRGARP